MPPLALFKVKESDTHPSKYNEEIIPQIKFHIHKFNNRPKPSSPKRILIICCFSEFGCETVGVTHCIPKLIKRFPGMYIIAMGWYGRSYLYRHLVDEYWEIDESHMCLRDRCFAFHHKSKNLQGIEEQASKRGIVIPSAVLGKYAIGNACHTCGAFWNEWRYPSDHCPKCNSTVITNSLFGDAERWKEKAVKIPKPSKIAMDWASQVIKKPSVGVFARSRKTYGRNLDVEFYKQLLVLLEQKGYNPIWLGEKQTTLPCPFEHITDFSRLEESRDLEKTLAIVCNCEFTIQFWTASSRLAGLMGVPFLLVESPDQLYSFGYPPGQEGRRLELTSFGEKKIVLAHYLQAAEKTDILLKYVENAIDDMQVKNYNEIITELVADVAVVELMKKEYEEIIKGTYK